MTNKNLRRWDPFRELFSMRDNMDHLFNAFFGRPPEEIEDIWSPVIDIAEDNENSIIKVEIPGLKKENIKISVCGNIFSISGERKQESETKGRTFRRVKRAYGKFNRTITLPADVEADKAKAIHKDGVLTITLPKPESMKRKEIEVEIK